MRHRIFNFNNFSITFFFFVVITPHLFTSSFPIINFPLFPHLVSWIGLQFLIFIHQPSEELIFYFSIHSFISLLLLFLLFSHFRCYFLYSNPSFFYYLFLHPFSILFPRMS